MPEATRSHQREASLSLHCRGLGCICGPPTAHRCPPRCEPHKSAHMARSPRWKTAILKGAAAARGQPQGSPGWGLQPKLLAAPSPGCKQCLLEVKAGPCQHDPRVNHTCNFWDTSPPLPPSLSHDSQIMGTSAGAPAATMDHKARGARKLCRAPQSRPAARLPHCLLEPLVFLSFAASCPKRRSHGQKTRYMGSSLGRSFCHI